MQSNNENEVEIQTYWDEHFPKYLHQNWKKGCDIHWEASNYVTRGVLTTYWTKVTVSSILNKSSTPIPIAAELILERFLRVWSTLVYIGCPQFITWFRKIDRDDDFFFSSGFKKALTQGHDPQVQDMLEKFGSHWGKFWPVRFTSGKMHKRDLDSQEVLPVTSWKQLSRPESTSRTTIYEVDLDPECCEDSNNKVVFKLYPDTNTDPAASLAFSNEVDIFETLGRSCEGVIVDYLGSFIQNGASVVVLEHANGGNLGDFFRNHRVPRNNQELIYLWKKLFKLSKAIYHLHHPGRTKVGITHRDLKFENILFIKKGTEDDYKFEFKLTDFDTSTLQKTQNGYSHQDNDGSRTHCAPEQSRIIDISESKSEEVHSDSDVWQLGTVFSQALICILWDWNSLSTYEERRRKETSTVKQLEESGLEICFHNGKERLACIQEIHEEALGSCKSFDRISEPLVKLIEDEMLIPHEKGRTQPKFLTASFEKLLKRSERASVIQDERPHRSGRHPVRTQTIPGAVPGVRAADAVREESSQQDIVTPQQLLNYIEGFEDVADPQNDQPATQTSEIPQDIAELENGDTKQVIIHDTGADAKADHESSMAQKESAKSSIPQLTADDVNLWRTNKKMGGDPPQGLDEIIDLLQGRDQLIIVDDSKSMKDHLSKIKPVAEAMISLAKNADPDGVELVFTSKPGEVKKKSFFTFKSETDDLVKQIIARFGKDKLPEKTNMENRLGTILKRIGRTAKPTSIYVLTDGLWMESNEPGGGVENPIKTLISTLKRGGQTRDFVTIQFIQFGDSQMGSDRLAWLDDDLPKSSLEYRDFDIVDTRKYNDKMYLLMIGALRRYIDEFDTGKVG